MRRGPASLGVGSPTLHATVLFTLSVFVAILVMSYALKVEIVAKGTGKIVPLGRVQVVQPEFAGQLAAIHVRDGMRVARGAVVIELDPTNAQSALNTLRAEEERLQIERRRIETVLAALPAFETGETDDISVHEAAFLGDAPQVPSRFFKEQRALLTAELTELRDALVQIDARLLANEKSKEVTRAGIGRIDAALETQQERLETVQSLLDKGTASRANYLDVLDGFNTLESEREVFLRELDEKTAQDASYMAERAGILSALRSRLQTRRAELEARGAALSEELVIARRQLANTRLVAPETGVIDQLSVFTIGGIVEAGQELLRVVPADQAFEVEAIFPNIDVGFLEVGQKANVKLDAYPAERFGALEGVVSNVSADAIEVETNSFGFVVRIAPDTPRLETATASYAVQPGMTAVVDVITGERRLISYFFAPIVKVVQDSLGER
ncbi:HlyD family type I secretion periplasmic adaptor subunit [Roseobacter sinensis]|uniref:Membrane fusion protein (MFP) family protein n=1 Tax=Roseobacter sinensis TaxID=2931391 RepID=A0ABT3BEM2_9RHOB|nr:HlyD family type I secretion periplasmic adaptor subunit [Roseobacter sp. WL0113]MCV3272031.1 HlyD family type I secretion periplasmic adaptor subunit [Roseobacter sp. WL0113]